MIDRAVRFVPVRFGRLARTFASVALLLGSTACGDRAAEDNAADTTDAAAEPAPPAAGASLNDVAQEYAPALGVDLSQMTRSGTGLYVQDLQEGTGDPVVAGDTVLAHYTGWLPDGSKFDSSLDRGEPIPIRGIGTRQVIPGWDEGLQGMRVGGRRRLVIPPALAYGAEGRPPVIPPASTLVFDVEIVEIR